MINTKELLMERGIEALGRFYSFYRGMVVENEDPNHMNSLQVATRNPRRYDLMGFTIRTTRWFKDWI